VADALRETRTPERKGKYGMNNFTVTVTDGNGAVYKVGTFKNQFVRHPATYVRSLLDSSVMFNGFGKDFTDLDMVKEVNGYLLNIEFKHDLRAVLSNRGQLLLAINTVKVSKMTSFFVEGTPENPRRMFSVSPFRPLNEIKVIQLNGADDLKRRIEGWERAVRKLPGVNGNKWEDVNNLIAALESVI
jgi:hypothetical protein